MTKELICIVCPNSCRLMVSGEETSLLVEGAQCGRGVEFAKNEIMDPRRMLTTTVCIGCAEIRRLPVVTTAMIPKGIMRSAIDILKGVKVEAPIASGDVVLRDICGTGIDVVATRTLRFLKESHIKKDMPI